MRKDSMNGCRRFFTPGVLALAGFLAVAVPVAPPAAAEGLGAALSARELDRAIAEDGARQVARELDRGGWLKVRRAVTYGWEGWIELLPKLIPFMDDETTKAMQKALRSGLFYRPRAVLAILQTEGDSALKVHHICSPRGMRRSWRKELASRIASVEDKELRAQKLGCLSALKQ